MLDARAVGLVKQRAGQRELFGRVDLVGGVLTGDGLRHPGQGQIAASLEPADEPEASAAIGGDPGIEERLRTVIEIKIGRASCREKEEMLGLRDRYRKENKVRNGL